MNSMMMLLQKGAMAPKLTFFADVPAARQSSTARRGPVPGGIGRGNDGNEVFVGHALKGSSRAFLVDSIDRSDSIPWPFAGSGGGLDES